MEQSKINYPLYSVLMAVYKNDNPRYLEESILSMEDQTVPPDEIILVEDGELTKELYEIISLLSVKLEHLKVVPLANNQGLGHALNCGIKQCRNELIARMDADDISVPNRCEKQLEKFIKNPNLVIVGTQINEFSGDPTNIVSSRRVPENYNEILKFAHRRSPFNHPTVMYKKSEVLKYKGYNSYYTRKEDLDLFLRMVFGGCYSENLPEVLLNYRTDDENLKRRKSWINCREYISVMWKFFQEKKISIADIGYVVIGQLVMFITPERVIKKLNQIFLRN